jgi:hypothetical protein
VRGVGFRVLMFLYGTLESHGRNASLVLVLALAASLLPPPRHALSTSLPAHLPPRALSLHGRSIQTLYAFASAGVIPPFNVVPPGSPGRRYRSCQLLVLSPPHQSLFASRLGGPLESGPTFTKRYRSCQQLVLSPPHQCSSRPLEAQPYMRLHYMRLLSPPRRPTMYASPLYASPLAPSTPTPCPSLALSSPRHGFVIEIYRLLRVSSDYILVRAACVFGGMCLGVSLSMCIGTSTCVGGGHTCTHCHASLMRVCVCVRVRVRV